MKNNYAAKVAASRQMYLDIGQDDKSPTLS